jgi:hypothetical protein
MMDMSSDQIWTIVLGVLLAISEILGSVKRGPNGILHAVWKFYNLKVELEYSEEGEHEADLSAQERVTDDLTGREMTVVEDGIIQVRK